MAYIHIDNLYKNQEILLFKECYSLEKIHGTSCHISYKNGKLFYSSAGIKHKDFVKLFNEIELIEKFKTNQYSEMIIYGEGYAGKCQGMGKTYGSSLKFVAFEVKIDNSWLSVPQAHEICTKLGLDFVPYRKILATIEEIDKERDTNSIQAIKNGMGEGHKREGVVLRPLIELRKNNGDRIIAKHKREEFSEIKTPRPINKEKLEILIKANDVAEEWVTENRLIHILGKFQEEDIKMENTGKIVKFMLEDIYREAKGEIIESKEVSTAIGRKTAHIFKNYLKKAIYNEII
jgi:hypothetical protein